MGNAVSQSAAYSNLARELPATKEMGYDDNWLSVDKGMKVFADEKDREQFIYAIIAVSTSNGALDLSGADYKLLYSRRQRPQQQQHTQPPSPPTTKGGFFSSVPKSADVEVDDGTYLIASIAAMQQGRIVAKIESVAGGADQRQAFLALKRHVEVKLDGIMQSVPSVVGSEAGPSTQQMHTQGVPDDMPPSYQSSTVDMVPRKEKA